MSDTKAFIIKLNQPANGENEYALEREMFVTLNQHFTEKEQKEELILDEENMTIIAFLAHEDKYKLDAIVEAANGVQPGIVAVFEDITDKIVYKNDFSQYEPKSNLIDRFIKSKLNIDKVLEKITAIGMSKLTEVDMQILKQGV